MLKALIGLMTYMQNRRHEERGASAVEYGLLVAAIAAAIVVIVFLLGDVVTQVFTDTCQTINGEAGTGVGCGIVGFTGRLGCGPAAPFAVFAGPVPKHPRVPITRAWC